MKKITTEELQFLFGPTMPIEAGFILNEAKDPDEARDKLYDLLPDTCTDIHTITVEFKVPVYDLLKKRVQYDAWDLPDWKIFAVLIDERLYDGRGDFRITEINHLPVTS